MLLLLRLILLIVIIRAVLMLVRGVMQGASGGDAARPPVRPAQQLMRDPVCGVYVTPGKAIVEQRGVGTAYFCSERCRQAWIHR